MSPSETPPAHVPVHPVLWIMVAIMVGFELLFAAADAGLAPQALGRWPVYQRLAFFDFHPTAEGLVRAVGVSASGIYYAHAGPEVGWTFLTHAFLHGGWLHLAVNGAAFLGLGHMLVQAVGVGRFLIVFTISAAAGALAFWQLAESPFPMVGASGALFGFLAVITAWQERALRQAGLSRAPIWRRIFGLTLLNVLLAVGLLAAGFGGLLAWEAHLGGWIAGWLLAGVFRPRGRGMAGL